MRTMILSGLLACTALAVNAQDAAPVSSKSDSWARPAAAASVSYKSTAATVNTDNAKSRFKQGSEQPKFSVQTPLRPNGRPQTLCQQNPTASTCR